MVVVNYTCYVDAVDTCFLHVISLSVMESATRKWFHVCELLDEFTRQFL